VNSGEVGLNLLSWAEKVAPLILVLLLVFGNVPPTGADGISDHPPGTRSKNPPALNSVSYVNFTSSSKPGDTWQEWWYGVVWPSPPWSQITVTEIVYNNGDPWDRVNEVSVDNVTVLWFTNKENTSGPGGAPYNPVQSYTVDITYLYDLFLKPTSTVRWEPWDTFNGGWWAGLSFAFLSGDPPEVYGEVIGGLDHFDVTSGTGNAVTFNVTFPANISYAKAFLYEEGFGGGGGEEFWFWRTPPSVRDFTLDLEGTTRLFDLFPYPYIQSGGCFNFPSCDTLKEWNASAPPGVGPRFPKVADLSPYGTLLSGGTRNLTLTIWNANFAGSFWRIAVFFIIWRDPDLPTFSLLSNQPLRSGSGTSQTVVHRAVGERTIPNGVERLYVNHSGWMNSSGFTAVTNVHEDSWTTRLLTASPVSAREVSRTQRFHNVTQDASTALDIEAHLWTVHERRAWGNGQDSLRVDWRNESRWIDGSAGGLSTLETNYWQNASLGSYAHLSSVWDLDEVAYANLTGTDGISTPQPQFASSVGSGTPVAFPALFFLSPLNATTIQGFISLRFLTFARSLVNVTLSVDSTLLNVTGVGSRTWDTQGLSNGTKTLDLLTLDTANKATWNRIWVDKQAANLTITFDATMLGKRLLSFPVRPFDPTLPGLFSSIAGKFDKVRAFNASDAADPWKGYAVGKSTNDLLMLDLSQGFWINITQPGTLVISGIVQETNTIQLRAGWNLVGFPSVQTIYTVGNFKSDTGATRVETFSSLYPYYNLWVIPDGFTMQTGRGYWAYLPADISWVVSYN